MPELEIPKSSLQYVRDLASWSGIEDAVDDDLLRVISAPVVAAELRRLAGAPSLVLPTEDLLDLLRARADELDQGD
ncbi:hypothetical protein LQ327_17420 [Actinomycetospora endophytica]|uniref:Uncharacterized protein n=1 Tax=Actinomycetospora endophytica TaxID=2291215 RepID=A0ABS8PA60_9PSEU|nr:hypothetical protein [Actinomycetospora endophytica]MCD2195150.1 hypothetical protein [Actinomycetospora endophytica]